MKMGMLLLRRSANAAGATRAMVLFCCLFLLFLGNNNYNTDGHGARGGVEASFLGGKSNCVLCTLVTNTLFQYAAANNNDIAKALDKVGIKPPHPAHTHTHTTHTPPQAFYLTLKKKNLCQACTLLPSDYQKTCDNIVLFAGPILIELFAKGTTAVGYSFRMW